MNIAHLGLVSSAAATPLAHARSSEADRMQQESAVHERQVESTAQAEAAEGIGTTSEEQAASDRDADGRRPWEIPGGQANPSGDPDVSPDVAGRPKDPTGQAGSQLDLSG